MDAQTRESLSSALRKAAELLGGSTSPAIIRKDVLAAVRRVQEAFLALGFDEQASRKRLVYFLRSVRLANGVLGARTAQRLLARTFEEEAELAEKWLFAEGILLDQGDEGILLTETGAQYLEAHRAEFPTLPSGAERRGGRGGRDHQHARGGRQGSDSGRGQGAAASPAMAPAAVVTQTVAPAAAAAPVVSVPAASVAPVAEVVEAPAGEPKVGEVAATDVPPPADA